MRQQNHYAVLDGLRGLAAISVVLYHLGHWLNVPFLATNSGLSVDFFFCLSGFVLPNAYGQATKPGLSFLAFAKTRLLRLMPLILLATIISAIYVAFRLIVTHHHGEFDHLLLATILGLFALPYLNAPAVLGGPQVFPLNGPEYTLFLELGVNALWFPLRGIALMMISAVIAAIGVLGLVAFGGGGDTAATFWHGVPRVAASFFIGVLVYEMVSRGVVPGVMRRLFWPLCLLSLLLFYFPVAFGLDVTLCWVIVIAPLLVLSGCIIRPAGWVRKLCLWGGAASYPIYVLQYPIFCWLNGGLQIILHRRIPALEVPLILGAVIGLSYLALVAFDQPVRRALSRPAVRLDARRGLATQDKAPCPPPARSPN